MSTRRGSSWAWETWSSSPLRMAGEVSQSSPWPAPWPPLLWTLVWRRCVRARARPSPSSLPRTWPPRDAPDGGERGRGDVGGSGSARKPWTRRSSSPRRREEEISRSSPRTKVPRTVPRTVPRRCFCCAARHDGAPSRWLAVYGGRWHEAAWWQARRRRGVLRWRLRWWR